MGKSVWEWIEVSGLLVPAHAWPLVSREVPKSSTVLGSSPSSSPAACHHWVTFVPLPPLELNQSSRLKSSVISRGRSTYWSTPFRPTAVAVVLAPGAPSLG